MDRELAADGKSVLADPVSPELVLVLPTDQRRLVVESLPALFDSLDQPWPRPSAAPESAPPSLPRGRLAVAAGAYACSRVIATLPFCITLFVSAFVVTLLLSASR